MSVHGSYSGIGLVLLAFGLCAGRVLAIDSAGSGFWDVGGTWVGGNVPTIADDVTIKAGHTVTCQDVLTHDAKSLVIENTGVLTHTANSTTAAGELYKVILNIANNMTIDSGGQINVDGRGYVRGQGPGGKPSMPRCSGSYGGKGGPYVDENPGSTSGPTYGSITAPTNCGSGGGTSDGGHSGGGAVLLVVAGTSTVNGVVSASGMNRSGNAEPCGSGGSVFLATGWLTGSGILMADGGNEWGYGCPSGGGGRIAVILNNSTDFGNVNIHAYAGTRQTGTAGGAGTVYLKTQTQGPGQGTLVIDAGNRWVTAGNTTLISSNVTDTVVGSVIITNLAIFEIATNQSLTVNGSWTNKATFIARSNSTLVLGGTNTGTISCGNTFYNLACTNAGKTVLFASGTTNFVNGNLLLGAGVTLLPSVPGSWWYLTLAPGGTQQVGAVRVQDSNAGGGQTIVANKGSLDLGHNLNWGFLKYAGTIFCGR